MRRIILDTDVASLSIKQTLPPALLRELLGAQIGLTFRLGRPPPPIGCCCTMPLVQTSGDPHRVAEALPGKGVTPAVVAGSVWRGGWLVPKGTLVR